MAPTDRTPVAEEYEYYQVLGGARINIYAFIHQPDGLRNMRATPLGRRHTMTPFLIYESKTHSIRRHKQSKMTEEKTIYYYKQTGLPVRVLQATLNGHQLTFTSRK
jgi:hypothetical protein